MNNQALVSLKDKSKELKCRLLQFLFGALRVKTSRLVSKKCGTFGCCYLLTFFADPLKSFKCGQWHASL